MIKKFVNYIIKNNLPKPEDNFYILLAVSGGIDSVVMCDIFHKLNYKFSIAHANFGLRDKDSELDQQFVENLALKYNVKCFTKKFETEIYAEKNKLSIQMAARELRFNWFYEICNGHSFNFIATAHHSDDQAETFFINIFRGASLNAIGGIKPISEKIIHPLLFASRNDIINYAKKNKLSYRNDLSNESDKYLRNKIRHNLLPLIENIHEGATKSIISTTQKIQDANEFINNIINELNQKIIKKHSDYIEINTSILFEYKPVRLYLYETIKKYGFKYNVCDEIIAAANKELIGKTFLSESYKLLIDRKKILIQDILSNNNKNITIINNTDNECLTPIKLKIEHLEKCNNFIIPTDKNIACLDYDKIKFPLTLKLWEKGNKFYPLGMKKPKKISDFLIDNKVPLLFKDEVYVLSSDNRIVWVIGMRIDDRFKVTNKTQRLLIIYKI